MSLNVKTTEPANPILDAAAIAAEELQTLRERLSCDTRHSFRTPLTVIDGTARRLARNADSISPEEITNRVHTIRETVEKMVEIVERSIEMSELASCVKEDMPAQTPLRSVVTRLIQEHKQISPKVGFNASFDGCENLIATDKRLVELLLDKLLSLGVNMAQEYGRIELVTWSDGVNANFSLKAIFDARSPKDVSEIKACVDEAEERLTLLCRGMELKLIRVIVEQNGGELEIVKEPALVEFDLCLPIEQSESALGSALISTQKPNATEE